MKRSRNKSLWKKAGLFLLVLVVIVLRIVWVNVHAAKETTQEYSMGEWVPLSGDFCTSAEEKTDGYSLRVDAAKRYTYAEYMQETEHPEQYFGETIQSPVLELTLTLRNTDNTDGLLPVSQFNLLNENRTIYNRYDPLYAGLKNPLLESSFGVTIRPQTEFTIHLPFTMQYGPENCSFLEENDSGVYYLVISRYPVRKEVKITVG